MSEVLEAVLKEASLGFYTILAFIGAVSIASVIMYPIFYIYGALTELDVIIGGVFLASLALAGKHGAYTLSQYGARRRMLLVMLMTMSIFLFGAIVGIYFGEPGIVIAIPAAYVANMLLKHFYLQGMGVKAPLKQLFRWWEIP